ncbi:MAG: efflux RND transporter periplasmic adaptor subunit [Gemmatimonadetes bacterium]|nr:efflux RND transporter periplasmic adaptor subunit [Gemmatimonadota bacterium]
MAAVAAVGLAACFKSDTGDIEATGTIEVREVDVGPTSVARVSRMLVDEGSTVHKGDTLAVLNTPNLAAALDEQAARARSAVAALQEVEKGARSEEIKRAEADLAAAESDVVRTSDDLARIAALARSQNVSEQQLSSAQAAARTAAARRDAAQSVLRLLREGSRPERIAAARAEAQRAEAAVSGIRATASDLILRSPVAGIVTSRNAEPGEVLGPGQSAVTVGETARPFVRVFVNQGSMPRLKPGQKAVGVLDDYPDRKFEGTVTAISTRAEFTPRVALTEKERADLLFGVKVEFADTTGTLKAGLPITVTIAAPPVP